MSVRAIVYFRKTKTFRDGGWLITLICQVACEQGISEYATSALLVEKLDGHQGVRLQRRAAQLERVAL